MIPNLRKPRVVSIINLNDTHGSDAVSTLCATSAFSASLRWCRFKPILPLRRGGRRGYAEKNPNCITTDSRCDIIVISGKPAQQKKDVILSKSSGHMAGGLPIMVLKNLKEVVEQ
jgi:hypothetical protein